nr:carboxypeptidase B-like isoform X1 [Procambarus clarkii]
MEPRCCQQWRPVVLLLVFVSVACCVSDNYQHLEGHQVLVVEVGSSGAVKHLLQEGLLDVLDHSGPSRTVRVSPQTVQEVKTALREAGISYSVLIHDLAAYLREKDTTRAPRRNRAEVCVSSSCPAPLIDSYMTFQQIEWYLTHLASHPRVEVTSIGKSVEGRDLWLVHIKPPECRGDGSLSAFLGRLKAARESKRRRAVWLEAGIHGREWIAPAVALQLIHNIVQDCSAGRALDIYVVPVANPDGYVYSWTNDRMWRKNRRQIPGSDCDGVDLNRNWDFQFGVGASHNPCSEVYQGAHAFSEPETQALSNVMLQVNRTGKLMLVLVLHSYGQLLMYPFGHTTDSAPNTPAMQRLGDIFAKSAKESHGTVYDVANSAAGLYYASGATDDWAKGELKTKFAYTLELRDKKTFFLSPDQILPTSEEVWNGMKMVFVALTPERGI